MGVSPVGVSPSVGVSSLTPPRPQEAGEEPGGPLQKTPIILAKPPAERVSLGGVASPFGGVASHFEGVATPKMGVATLSS